MIDTATRIVYERAEREQPLAYSLLRDIDSQLADLHARGMLLQRTRLALLRDLAAGTRFEDMERIPVTAAREIEPALIVGGWLRIPGERE